MWILVLNKRRSSLQTHAVWTVADQEAEALDQQAANRLEDMLMRQYSPSSSPPAGGAQSWSGWNPLPRGQSSSTSV